MSTSKTRASNDAAKPEAKRPPLKRFLIERLEERIAPKKGGKGTHNCGGGGGGSNSGSGGSSSVY